ncbi:hypothetical protein D9M71_112840 [compost metagenome]
MQGCNQLLHCLGILVVFTGNQNVHVRRVSAFDDQCIRLRVQLGFQRVVGVDQRQVDLGQHARDGRGFQFADFQVLGVLGDVLDGRQDVVRILQLDQAGLGHQQQRTAAVGSVVRDDHVGTARQFSDGLVLAGVSAQGLQMHASHRNQMGALGLVELIQVRLVLEEVGVQALFRDLHVRLDVVSEDLDLQVHAFFGQGRLHEFEDLGVWHRGGCDGQGVSRVGRECGNGSEGDE